MGSSRAPAARSPVWLVLAAIASLQLGAALAKTQFDDASPVAMVWLRMVFAGLLLLLARPTFRGLTRQDWRTGIVMAACLAGMNWSIYEAFSRIPIGLAVTIEFMGPLLVALTGCRRILDTVWVFLAGTGVVLLGLGSTHLDPLGILFASVAGAGWAGYIVFGARLSTTWKRASVLLLSSSMGAVALAGPAIASAGAAILTPTVLATGLVVGFLSSALPYSLELRALQLMPRRIFGILQALGPVAAALAALLVLRERLGAAEWAAIICIVIATIGATWRRRARRDTPDSGDGPPQP